MRHKHADMIIDGINLRYIPGFHNTYAASECGKIYSIRRNKWMKIFSSLNGYMRTNLSMFGVKKSKSIHRLVAFAWIKNPQSLPQINHINGVKTDNSIENLEWSDASHQRLHAMRLGLVKTTQALRDSGKRNGKSRRKLTYEQANEIRASDLSLTKIALLYGVSRRCIHFIKKGESYVDR